MSREPFWTSFSFFLKIQKLVRFFFLMFQSPQNSTQITCEYGGTFVKHCCRCENMTDVHFQHVAQRLSQEKGETMDYEGTNVTRRRRICIFPSCELWCMRRVTTPWLSNSLYVRKWEWDMHRAKVAYSVFFFFPFLLQAQFSVTFFDGLWVERVYPQLLCHIDTEPQPRWDRLQHGSDRYSVLPRWTENSGWISVIIRLVVFLSQTALLSSFLIFNLFF